MPGSVKSASSVGGSRIPLPVVPAASSQRGALDKLTQKRSALHDDLARLKNYQDAFQAECESKIAFLKVQIATAEQDINVLVKQILNTPHRGRIGREPSSVTNHNNKPQSSQSGSSARSDRPFSGTVLFGASTSGLQQRQTREGGTESSDKVPPPHTPRTCSSGGASTRTESGVKKPPQNRRSMNAGARHKKLKENLTKILTFPIKPANQKIKNANMSHEIILPVLLHAERQDEYNINDIISYMDGYMSEDDAQNVQNQEKDMGLICDVVPLETEPCDKVACDVVSKLTSFKNDVKECSPDHEISPMHTEILHITTSDTAILDTINMHVTAFGDQEAAQKTDEQRDVVRNLKCEPEVSALSCGDDDSSVDRVIAETEVEGSHETSSGRDNLVSMDICEDANSTWQPNTSSGSLMDIESEVDESESLAEERAPQFAPSDTSECEDGVTGTCQSSELYLHENGAIKTTCLLDTSNPNSLKRPMSRVVEEETMLEKTQDLWPLTDQRSMPSVAEKNESSCMTSSSDSNSGSDTSDTSEREKGCRPAVCLGFLAVGSLTASAYVVYKHWDTVVSAMQHMSTFLAKYMYVSSPHRSASLI